MQKVKFCKHIFQTVLLDYQSLEINGEQRIEETFWIPVVLQIGNFLIISELLCYIYFFWDLYKYNNGLSIIPQETKKSRNRTNAQTMMGQFYMFLTNALFIMFLTVGFSSTNSPVSAETKDLGVIFKSLEFGLFSFMHCYLIPELRIVILKYFSILNFKQKSQ